MTVLGMIEPGNSPGLFLKWDDMPAAKPKTSKKYATIGRKREKVFGPEMQKLLNYLVEHEVLSDVISGHQADTPGFGTGSYDPVTKDIAVLSGDSESGDETAGHEIVHLLADRESKPDRMSKEMEKLPYLMKRDLVFPKHWVEGKMADIPTRRMGGKIKDMARTATQRRVKTVRDSIPEGARWSGIPPTSYGSFLHRDSSGEGSAYYMTNPLVASPQGDRAKEFGMYLLNHDIPMDIVEPVVKRMSGIAKPEKRWSGGSYELEELRKRVKKNPGYSLAKEID